ncbi:MAG TPA: hypothetical protein P5136_02295 [Methanofastidiosum sp.]|nr:hypothetical protein [Methanofastidiosum sp.]
MAGLFDRLFKHRAGSAKTSYVSAGLRDNLMWGPVVKVDSETLLMDVLLPSGSRRERQPDIPINISFTNDGYGLRVLPTPGESVALVYKVNSKEFIHVGYYYADVAKKITNASGTKESNVASLLKRNIESGEAQLVGLTNNEIYLSNDGSVLLKAQFGASLYLDNYMHRLSGAFANFKYEMDGVRLRGGNIIRPVVEDTNEEDFMILDENGDVTDERSLDKDKDGISIREFQVQVGIEFDPETGVDKKENDDKGSAIYPTVGSLTMADRIVNEVGEEIKIDDKSLNFRLKLTSGCSLAIDEEGSFLILDDKNGSFTKFGTGEKPDKSIRSGDTMLRMNEEDGLYLKHESGTSIQMDKDGNLQINDSFNNSILMQEKGITINSADGDVTILGKKILLCPEKNVYIGSSESAADTVLTAGGFGTVYDNHKHVGPVGPVNPADQLSLPSNAQNSSVSGLVVT